MDEAKITERVVIHQDRVLEDIRVLINAAYKEGYADGKSEAVVKQECLLNV